MSSSCSSSSDSSLSSSDKRKRSASTTRIQISLKNKNNNKADLPTPKEDDDDDVSQPTFHRSKPSLSSRPDKKKLKDWPSSSASSLPPLSTHVLTSLKENRLEFSINDECTSLKMVPSGRHVVAGFSDGTMRLFDLTGRFHKALDATDCKGKTDDDDDLFDMDSDDSSSRNSSDDDEEQQHSLKLLRNSNSTMVLSKTHQQHGAVAAQIHARGVHTSLLMRVDVSQDGLYCFAGVSRGSVELVAIDMTQLELYHDSPSETNGCSMNSSTNMLDLVKVHRHADAKLKGFEACTRLRQSNNSKKYLLFTGRGIKNIHIWSFTPSTDTKADPEWQCLYDTQTNGNSINLLCFRHDPHGLLQGLSKSDDQKLRIWDLSYEQHEGNSESIFFHKQPLIKGLSHNKAPLKDRPKRPPYMDVASSESTLGVAGPFLFCGGGAVYNQMSVVGLDVENVSLPYNHTELALPSSSPGKVSRRQQRGELKSISNVAGMVMDAGHVLLELSDGSVVQYSQNELDSVGLPSLSTLDPSTFLTRSERLNNVVGNQDGGGNRQYCLTRVGSQGVVVAASSQYNSNAGRGSIVLRQLGNLSPQPKGFWGFHGVGHLNNTQKSSPSPDAAADKTTSFPSPQERPSIAAAAKSSPSQHAAAHSIVTPKTTRKAVPQLLQQRSPTKATSTEAHPVVESPPVLQQVPNNGTPRVEVHKQDAAARVTVTPQQPSPHNGERHQIVTDNKKDGDMLQFLRPSASNVPVALKKKSSARELPGNASIRDTSSREGHNLSKSMVTERKAARVEKHSRTPKSKKQPKRKDPPCDNGDGKKIATPKTMDGAPKQAKRSRAHSPKTPSRGRAQNGDAGIRKVAGALCDMRKGATPSRNAKSPLKPRGINARPAFLSPKLRRKRPKPLTDTLPKTTVAQRFDLIESSVTSCSSIESSREQTQRQQLAAKHRAEHEMLRRRVLASVDRVIQHLVAFTPISIEEGRSRLEEDVAGFEEMLHDMIARQKMEASALSAEQSLNNEGVQVTELQVSFPFPEVFSQARASFQTFVSGRFK